MIMSSRPMTLAAAYIDPVGETPATARTDSPEQPEAHLIVITRDRDHETNLPNASDTQALSQSEGCYLRV